MSPRELSVNAVQNHFYFRRKPRLLVQVVALLKVNNAKKGIFRTKKKAYVAPKIYHLKKETETVIGLISTVVN